METIQSSNETSQTSEASRRDPIEEFQRDIRALLGTIGLQDIKSLGSSRLSRDGFESQACTDAESTAAHLLTIYTQAKRRRGKIRHVVCNAIAGKYKKSFRR